MHVVFLSEYHSISVFHWINIKNMVFKRLLNVVRSFLLFSNVHGFSYVADREIHWIGR